MTTVANAIVRFMEQLGITHAFGIPGAHILPVYEQLRTSKIKTILVKHEENAAFMAHGFHRAHSDKNKIVACVTTAGPGATNLITGLVNAYATNTPLLAIVAETSTWIFGKGGLQEGSGEGGSFNLMTLLSAVTKYHCRIDSIEQLESALQQAAITLQANKTGPVCLVIPYDIQKTLISDTNFSLPAKQSLPLPAEDEINALATMIGRAHTPVFIAGNAAHAAAATLLKIAQHLNISVATTLRGKGCIDDTSTLSLGCLGITSDARAYKTIVDAADLLIFLGASFNERTSYLWDAKFLSDKKIIRVDHDAAKATHNFFPDLFICNDVALTLQALIAHHSYEKIAPKKLPIKAAHITNPHFHLIEHLFAKLPQKMQIVDDNIILAQTYFCASPSRRYFPNGGISSLGYAIPAALGAYIGARIASDIPTFAIIGDGGFHMCAMELMTAVNYNIPITILLINNGALGLIRKNQFQMFDGNYIDCEFQNPDFELLAQSFGIRYYKIEAMPDVDRIFNEISFSSINLIELIWDKNIFPGYVSNR